MIGRKAKVVIGIILIINIAIISTALAIRINQLTNSAKLEILVAPSSSSITIDGKQYENGTYNLKPGTYEITISKDGFITKNDTITLENDKITRFYTYLTENNGSLEYYKTDVEAIALLEQMSLDDISQEFVTNYYQKTLIQDVLPLIHSEEGKTREDAVIVTVRKGSDEECTESFCLVITDVPGGKLEIAKEMIRAEGYNPDDYEIIYLEGRQNV